MESYFQVGCTAPDSLTFFERSRVSRWSDLCAGAEACGASEGVDQRRLAHIRDAHHLAQPHAMDVRRLTMKAWLFKVHWASSGGENRCPRKLFPSPLPPARASRPTMMSAPVVLNRCLAYCDAQSKMSCAPFMPSVRLVNMTVCRPSALPSTHHHPIGHE